MADNNWRTQPRLKNGEFTFRGKVDMWQKILQKISESTSVNSISHVTKGGSYGELRKTTAGKNDLEIHHMPADSVSDISTWKGPCIILTKEDHENTSSFRNKKGAVAYREKQFNLIREQRFLDAEIMDIKDVLRKTGSKYVKAMIEKLDYDVKLYQEGKING